MSPLDKGDRGGRLDVARAPFWGGGSGECELGELGHCTY